MYMSAFCACLSISACSYLYKQQFFNLHRGTLLITLDSYRIFLSLIKNHCSKGHLKSICFLYFIFSCIFCFFFPFRLLPKDPYWHPEWERQNFYCEIRSNRMLMSKELTEDIFSRIFYSHALLKKEMGFS